MNTPNPSPAPPTDPTTPGAQGKPTALGAAATTAFGGGSVAVAVVWLIDSWAATHNQKLELSAEQAVAVGAVGASMVAYLAQVAQALLAKLTEWATRP